MQMHTFFVGSSVYQDEVLRLYSRFRNYVSDTLREHQSILKAIIAYLQSQYIMNNIKNQ